MVYRGEFDPYGNLVYEWGLAGLNTRKFTGYERDSNTGLDYANARMYGAGRGRFIQPDIKGLGSADFRRPQTLNRYAYVSNDPVNFVDPDGMLALIPKFDLCSLGFKNYCQSAPMGGGTYLDGNFLPEEGNVDGGMGGLVGINEAEVLNRAINSVKDRLNTRSECKALYGDLDVDDYLTNRISISSKDQNGNPFKSEKVYGSTGKDQYGYVTTVFNQNSSVFTGLQAGISMDAMLSQLSSDIRDKIGLKYIDSLAKFQELNVLHELLHAADRDGKKYFDTGNEQKTIANDRVIGELCFK